MEPSIWTEIRTQECLSDQTYVRWSNAWLEWKVKTVPLPKDVEVLLQYKLARYGMACDFEIGKPGTSAVDWLVVAKRTKVILDAIRMRRNTTVDEQLDNDFFLRLRLIHAELDGLTEVEELQGIPVAEMVFCLAVFLLALQDEAKYGLFKMLLTPVEVVLFLRAIVSSILEVQSKSGVKKYEKLFRKLRKLYSQVNELYHLKQARLDVMGVYNDDNGSISPQATLPQTITRLERVLKSELHLLPVLTTLLVEIIEGHTAVVGTCEEAEQFYNNISRKLPLLKILLEFALFLRIRVSYQLFLSKLRQCQSLPQIRYLCRWIGNMRDISEYHEVLLKQVEEFYVHLEKFTSGEKRENVLRKTNIIRDLQTKSLGTIINKLSQFAFIDETKSDLKFIKNSLLLDLTSNIAHTTILSIYDLWSNTDSEIGYLQSMQVIPPRVYELNIGVYTYFSQQNANSSKTTTFFNLFEREANSIMKSFYFDSSIEEIESILVQCDCSSIDKVWKNYETISTNVIVKLQCYLRRCFDYLQKANLLVHDKELLKSGHEMVFGKLFYNFLCTDDPSYRAMVGDCNLIIVLGSLVLSKVPYETLCKRRLLSVGGDLKDIRVDGHRWVELQNRLLKSYLNEDAEAIRSLADQGARFDGEFYCCLDEYGVFGRRTLKEIVACHFYNSLINNDTKTIPFVEEILMELDSPELKVKAALLSKKYEEAFVYSKQCINSLEMAFFNWESLVDSLVRAEAVAFFRNQEEFSEVVQKLIQHGNLQSIKTLLEINPYYIPSNEILVKAAQSGCENVFNCLDNLRKDLGNTVIFAGIAAHMNQAIEAHILQMNEECLREALSIAVRVNNLDFVKLLYEYSEKLSPILERILPDVIHMGRFKMVEIILDSFEIVDLNSLLFTAATVKRWNIVKLLVNRGADAHARRSLTTGFVTTFQHLVAAGCLQVVKLVALNSETVRINKDLELLTLAASTGSLKLMKYLLEKGFTVLNERNLLPVVWGKGREKFQKLLMLYLHPREWKSEEDTISTWFNLYQRIKYLPYLRFLANCPSLQQDTKLMQFVLRRLVLQHTVDAHWSIKDVGIVTDDQQQIKMSDLQDDTAVLSQYLEALECCLKKQATANVSTKEIHVFNLISKSYAFVELNSFGEQETTKFEIFNTDRPTTIGMLKDELLSRFKKTSCISCSIRIFHEEKEMERFEQFQSGFLNCLVEFEPVADGSTLMKHVSIFKHFPEIIDESRLVSAIKSCDLASVEWLLNCVGKVEHEDVCLDPKLAFIAIDNPGITISQKHKWLSKFHELGMKLCVVNPDSGLSAIAYAQSKGLEDLSEKMMAWSCEGLTKQQQFMMTLQQGSVEVFKLSSRKLNYSPEELFISISNALQEMHVKQVFISQELQMYLWFVLSDYGFNNLCTSLNKPSNDQSVLIISKNSQSNNVKSYQATDFKRSEKEKQLFSSIDYVIEVIRKLQNRSNREDVLDIDNEILFECRMIHKYLFFIKDDRYLKNLPLREMVFLLAVFLSTFNDHVDWHESNSVYRIVLSKPTLMNFLVLIADQLDEFRKQNLLRELSEKNVFVPLLNKQDRKHLKRLFKLHHRVKQMYSLRKIYHILNQFNPESNSKEITVASIKRFNQVFGECIKSTPKSQNIPSKLNQILNNQLCDYIRVIQKTRDVTCHDYPLGRKFLSLDDQFLYYSSTGMYLKMVKVTIAILMICTCHEYLRCLFGILRLSDDLVKLQSLIRYFGNQNNINVIQNECLDIIVKYHDELQQALNKVSLERLNSEEKKAFMRLKANYDKRTLTVASLKETINASFYYDYDEIQIVAFSATTVEEVHRLLQINLIPKTDMNILDFVEKNWEVLADDSYFLSNVLDTPETGVGFLITTLNRFEINQKTFHENYCLEEVQRIIKYFGVIDEIPRGSGQSIETKLSNSLKRYFNNIFLIDSKMQAITQVFGKKMIAKLNNKLNHLRRLEIEELQNIIGFKQRSIKSVLEQHNCSNIDLLIKNVSKIPQNALLAIEYWLMELCEILITTRRFQDNFYSIRHDVQMICGRNFRNYLAHDGLSYDVLTCSSHMKVLINALVMVEKEWDLLAEPKHGQLRDIFDSSIVGASWLNEQRSLANAALKFDLGGVETAIKQGSLSAGRFWMPNGNFEGLSAQRLSGMICSRNSPQSQIMDSNARKVVESIDPYFVGQWQLFLSSEQQLSMALQNSDFQAASSYLDGNTWGQLIRSKLISHTCLGGLFLYLEKREKHADILDILFNVEPKYTKSALSFRSDTTYMLILKEMPSKLTEIQIHAIIMSRPLKTELIPNHAIKFVHLEFAIMSNNLTFLAHYLESGEIVKNISEMEIAVKLCARLGRSMMMKNILETISISKTALNSALLSAVQYEQLRVALYLQQKGGNPWHRVKFQEYNAGEMAIVMCNSKIIRAFLKNYPAPFKHHYLLSGAAKYGSVRMVKLLLQAGCDIRRNNKVLLNVKDNKKDKSMEAFIQKTIFEYRPKAKLDSKLIEWIRIMYEYELVQNYKDFLPRFLCERDLAKKIFEKFFKLGKTDDGYSVSDIETCIMNTSYIDNLETFTSIDRNIEHQSPTGPPSKHKLNLEYQNNPKQTIQADLELFNAKTELPDTLVLAIESNFNPAPISISNKLIDAIDTQTESSAIVGQFKFLGQQFRFLRLGCCFYVGEIGSENISKHIQSLFNSTNPDGETILHNLSSDTDVELLEMLLSTGVDPALVDSKGRTALLFMLNIGCSWQVLEFMLQYCFEKDIRNSEGIHIFDIVDPQGCTLLSHAIAHGRYQVVERLLFFNVDQNIPNTLGKFPIHYAVLGRNVSIIKTLIANQSNVVNKQEVYSKDTPLFMAVKCNNAELVKILLDAGSDIGLKNNQGDTVVAIAIRMECNKALDTLLNHAKLNGIDVIRNIVKENGCALQYAMINDSVDTFKSVLEHIVESRIDTNMTQESLFRMKNVLLSANGNTGNVFFEAQMLKRVKIHSYLQSCEILFNKLTNESLREEQDKIWGKTPINVLSDSKVSGNSEANSKLIEIDDLD